MKTKDLVCVLCPNGCSVRVDIEESLQVCILNLEGCLCEAGRKWAEQEIHNPVRTVAGSIFVEDGDMPLVSVRTDTPIPLDKILAVMEVIREKKVQVPVANGDLLICNPAGVCCNIIATRPIARLKWPEKDAG
ncbi:MAG: DUF1667 domain-containing protein [Syntrophobacteraceae bacterium]